MPPADEKLRAEYERLLAAEGPAALHARLARVDSETAARLAPRDTQRVIRALEVAEGTGKPLSHRFLDDTEAVCDPRTPVFYLTRPRRELYERIEERCRKMVAAGLPEEVRRLLDSGIPRDAAGFKTVGYAEWADWVLGKSSREEAMDLFLRNSRRYAKRQETWFRNRHPQRIEIVIGEGEDSARTGERILHELSAGP
jgi:tRNA dimethylallyltransferase